MEASLFSVQLPQTTYTENTYILSEWRYHCYIQLIQRTHALCQNGGLSLSLSFFSLSLLCNCYMQLIQRKQSLHQYGGLMHLYTAAIYNWDSEGRHTCRMETFCFCTGAISNSEMEASRFAVQLPYTTHAEKANSLLEWSSTCHLQFILTKRTLCQNVGLSI